MSNRFWPLFPFRNRPKRSLWTLKFKKLRWNKKFKKNFSKIVKDTCAVLPVKFSSFFDPCTASYSPLMGGMGLLENTSKPSP
jgi:hypothetical protein